MIPVIAYMMYEGWFALNHFLMATGRTNADLFAYTCVCAYIALVLA